MFLVKPIRTRVFLPPKDDLFSLIRESLFDLKEKSIIVFTSKIISIWQGRCLKIAEVKNKEDLIKKEAEFYLERRKKDYPILTIKNNVLIPTAGIDESNGNGYYILWPKAPFLAAKKIYQFIKKNYHLKRFGILISDSHTIPMRWGTMGISLAYYGFEPLKDYRGKRDIFGRKFKFQQLNIADSLAASATLAMGEGNEQTPMAIIENLNFVHFKEFNFEKKNPLKIDLKKDIYQPLISAINWKRGL